MKKILLLHIGFVFSAASIFGQEIPKLKVTHRDMTNVIFRYPKDNETVVEVQSNVAIEFESTMDKTVNVFQSYEESGFFFYELLFPIGKKHKGRNLKIKSYGCETYTEPIELQAKIPVGLLVLNLNDTVGVGCYFRHLNRGNIFFKSTQYADAKTEYYLALECPDVPDDNDLSKKIEDAGTCLDSKRDADDYYNSSRLENALKEYEKVYAINPQDIYTKERIELCNEKIAVLPRIIRGRITASENGRALADVSVLAEFYQLDKKGKVKTNKNGMPKMEWRSIGKTDSNGRYEVTVLNQTKNLKFYKRTEEIVVKPEANSEKKDDDVGQIVGLITNVAGVMRFVYSGEASLTNDEVNLALGKKIGL